MRIFREVAEMKEFLLLLVSVIGYIWIMLYCVGRLVEWYKEKGGEHK